MNSRFWSAVLAVGACLQLWAAPASTDYAGHVASLIDPAKVRKLENRGANSHVQKCVYWLEMARRDHQDPAKVLDTALGSVKMKAGAMDLTKAALLRSLTIAERLGCLDAAGLEEMRHGNAPTIRRGPYKGDELSVDHIIPIHIAPTLENVIANLELMPTRMNSQKKDAVGDRQVSLAKDMNKVGLLSKRNLNKVLRAAR
jgi:hypothetical protein